MTWNYRIVHRKHGEEDEYAVHEIYYRDGTIEASTVRPVGPTGSTVNELVADLQHMAAALLKPVLEYDDLAKGS